MKAKLALFGGPRTVFRQAPTWPSVGPQEIRAVDAAIRAAAKNPDFLSSASGRGVVESFEKKFAAKMGARYAMAASGCGPALHTALWAAGVQAGDEVVCPSYSWGQTASCILQSNAVPVFADIDPETYTLTAQSIARRITARTRAVVVAHLFGHSADMRPIMALARSKGIPVIEDNAQATGALYRGRRTGSLADIGCFSIGNGKQIGGGEGGVLLTDDKRLFERAVLFGQHPARHLRQLRDPDLLAQSDSLIFTYRMHPLAAVICGAMLGRMDQLNAQRRRNYERLSRGLAGVPGIRPVLVRPNCRHVYHRYSPTFVPEQVPGISRSLFIRALRAEGVSITQGYVREPIHLRRVFREKEYFYGRGLPWSLHPHGKKIHYAKGDCPITEKRCAETELTLGDGPRWIGDQTLLVDQTLKAFHKVADNLKSLVCTASDGNRVGSGAIDAIQ